MKLALTLVALIPMWASAGESGPGAEKFLKGCFGDYVAIYTAPSLPTRDKAGIVKREKAKTAILKRCLTEDFRRLWSSIGSENGMDMDPWLMVQDYMDSWKDHISVDQLDLSAGTAEVVLGTPKELHCLKTKFIKDKAGFKITSTSVCPHKQ